MLFNSLQFLIFFPIVVTAYYLMPRRLGTYWLLAASYFFYMCWNAKYAVLLLFTTAVTYLSGLLLERIKQSRRTGRRRRAAMDLVVALSFVSNLLILFYYKYYNFAVITLTQLFENFHIQLHIPTFDILLPVGISFFTFQALSYTMDVYRDDIYAEKNFFRYALFVSFFPQLVAGPIERSRNLLRQLAKPKDFSYERAKEGLLLMLWGYFLKIVLADRIAIFVDRVYADTVTFGGLYILVATMLFAVQIYCDFSGYSTIAMGAARILGIDLMENFAAPYLAPTVAQFWRRWHISLTSWFKDYLYIPLGGSRRGKARKYLNKLIVFLVSGLWHGASISFVVWGGLNGLYQVISEMLEPLFRRAAGGTRPQSGTKAPASRTARPYPRAKAPASGGAPRPHRAKARILRLLRIIRTFCLVDFTWIFFRSDRFTTALDTIHAMVTVKNPEIFRDGSIFACALGRRGFLVVGFCIAILLFADICKEKGIRVREVILARGTIFQAFFVAASVLFILLFGVWGPGYDAASFIYFQF